MSSMIDRLRSDLDAHEARLDDHLRRIGVLESETERARKRLHRMEADRRAIQALVRTTQALAEQTRVLADKVAAGVEHAEEIAERAAEKAVTKADERKKAGRWRLAGRVATYLVAVSSFGTLLFFVLTR